MSSIKLVRYVVGKEVCCLLMGASFTVEYDREFTARMKKVREAICKENNIAAESYATLHEDIVLGQEAQAAFEDLVWWLLDQKEKDPQYIK